MNKNSVFLVFDVESIGLHGEGFAVGFCVVSQAGNRLHEGRFVCPPQRAAGRFKNRQWVDDNIPPLDWTHGTPEEVRADFWTLWKTWKEAGAILVADCCWPVEARFLAACVDDDPENREWEGPYPLHDLASVLLAHGGDPLAITDRRSDELPAHDPLNDARQSARILVDQLLASALLNIKGEKRL